MATGGKPYEATFKTLLRSAPADWLRFFGIGVGDAPVTTLDADLSSVSLAADGLFQVAADNPFGVHLEAESGHTGSALPDRLLQYAVLTEMKTGLPFRSVAVLLTKKADSPALTGTVTKRLPDGTLYLTFHYQVVRLWTLPPETFLNAGLSLLPLTLLGDVSAANAPPVVEQMRARIHEEARDEREERELLAATYLLTGAKYSPDLTRRLLKGAIRNVLDLRESSTYQEILEIGLAEGREKGITAGREQGRIMELRNTVLRVGTKRLGPPPATAQSAIEAATDITRLQTWVDLLLEVETWNEFEAKASPA